MKKFIELTSSAGGSIIVRHEKIIFAEREGKISRIYFSNGLFVDVKDSTEMINELTMRANI